MRHRIPLVAAALMAVFATTATAKDGNFGAHGTIAPNGCVPRVQDIDLGRIPIWQMKPGEDLVLDPRPGSLGIVCTGARKFTVKVTDMKAATVAFPGTEYFGLGQQINGHKNGAYTLSIVGTGLVGTARYVMSRASGAGGAWSTPVHDTVLVHQDKVHGFAQDAQAVEPLPLDAINIPLELIVTIASGLDLTEEARIEGEANIEIELL